MKISAVASTKSTAGLVLGLPLETPTGHIHYGDSDILCVGMPESVILTRSDEIFPQSREGWHDGKLLDCLSESINQQRTLLGFGLRIYWLTTPVPVGSGIACGLL